MAVFTAAESLCYGSTVNGLNNGCAIRLRVLSDLHLEYFGDARDLPEVAADVVILAGDIHSGTQGLSWAAARFPDTPVIYVPGNHEYYGYSMPVLRKALIHEAQRLGIHLLDNACVDIEGVRFIGTTLWTDFALYVDEPDADAALTYAKAVTLMPDFRMIEQPQGEVFTPEESWRLHAHAVQWLAQTLSTPFAGSRVIVSHHAPLAACIPPRFKGDPLSPAFASNLAHLMGKAELWVHGHVHETVDVVCKGTRVIANPGGYPNEFDTPSFIADWVVEIP